MDELESKVDYMIREIQVAGNRRRVGTCDAEIQHITKIEAKQILQIKNKINDVDRTKT